MSIVRCPLLVICISHGELCLSCVYPTFGTVLVRCHCAFHLYIFLCAMCCRLSASRWALCCYLSISRCAMRAICLSHVVHCAVVFLSHVMLSSVYRVKHCAFYLYTSWWPVLSSVYLMLNTVLSSGSLTSCTVSSCVTLHCALCCHLSISRCALCSRGVLCLSSLITWCDAAYCSILVICKSILMLTGVPQIPSSSPACLSYIFVFILCEAWSNSNSNWGSIS